MLMLKHLKSGKYVCNYVVRNYVKKTGLFETPPLKSDAADVKKKNDQSENVSQ